MYCSLVMLQRYKKTPETWNCFRSFLWKSNDLFHHNLPDSLSALSLNMHHVDAFGHLRQVDADLVAFDIGVVNRLSVGVHDADMAQVFALKGKLA